MQNGKIVVLDAGYESYEFEKELFEEAGYEFSVYPERFGSRNKKIEFAKGAVGVLVRDTLVDAEFIEQLPVLKAVVRYGVGFDNVDIEAATARGVKVAIVKGYANTTVAEHALMLAFACARSLVVGHNHLNTVFAQGPRPEVLELGRMTLGIVGLGRIGSELAIKSPSIFAQIIGCDPYIHEQRFIQRKVKRVNFEDLLARSDLISLHCNLTQETTHLLNEQAFAKMVRKPIIINTARGPVIEEKALLAALESGQIHSAGIDVFEEEPPHGEIFTKLRNHPNVITTGHYAFFSERSIKELQMRAAENILALLSGKSISDCLNL